MWGWTGECGMNNPTVIVNPTYVGMDQSGGVIGLDPVGVNPTYVGMDRWPT